MPSTPAERRALAVVAVAALGVVARVIKSRHARPAPTSAEVMALDAQIARVREARAAAKDGGRPKRSAKRADGSASSAKQLPSQSARDATPRAPVDLDTAGLATIEGLPWIGPSLAARIVESRERCGPFGSLEALTRVYGIGEGMSKRLAPHVTFSTPSRPIDAERIPLVFDLREGRRAPPARPVVIKPVHSHGARLRRVHTATSLLHNSSSRPPGMASTVAALPERITGLLLNEGIVSRELMERAQRDAKQNGSTVTLALIKTGAIDEVELTKIIARAYKMPAVDLSKFEVDLKILRLVPSELATKHTLLPLKRDGRTLTVAVADPTNQEILEDLKFVTRYDIFPVLGGEATLRSVIEKAYDAGDVAMDSLLKDIAAEGDVEVLEDTEEEMSAAALAAAVDDAPVVKLINAILTDAVKRGASDIHFESFEHELRVRYRIDGALQEVMKPPPKLKAALISRFKIMAQLNIAERRVPQDGRIKLKIGNKVIDYRVSTLPTLFGEKIVLRILDKGNLTLDLEKFGLEPRAERELMEAILNPYGMVLVTGPTGSGKTTTLYSALSKINTIDSNIMTAEDPVEYNLFGINQVQVRTDIGMTFAAALKAFLRQDPNIIMVGEIRDLETGGIAIKAALTGHLVLSTLHTNSAPETVTRLLDMGLEPFNVASALNMVVAQRLIRRVCPRCKQKYDPTPEELAGAKVSADTTLGELRFTMEALDNAIAKASTEAAPFLKNVSLDTTIGELPFFRGRGCDDCAGMGMKGRQGLYEVMLMTQELRKHILHNASGQEIKDAAVQGGMLTLRMDGWLKVMKGIVPLEQVIRETSA